MAVSLSGMTLLTNNDNETWTNTDGPDSYNESIQGTNSESWQIRKNENLIAESSQTAALSTSRGLVTVWLKSDVKNFYNSVTFILESSTNNLKTFTIANSTTQYCDGLWRNFALDYVNKGTSTGTFAPGSLTVVGWGLNMQNVNFRAIINNWCDAIYYGPGHTISGTTTGDKLFEEAAAVDQNGTNEYGILANVDDIIFCQGDLDLSGTSLTSDGEVLVFKDTPNGYDTYNLDVTGTGTFTNTTVIAAGTIDYNFDSSGATSFTMNGGSLAGYATLVTAASQTMSGIVFQSGGTATVANTIASSSFNLCGTITISGAGLLDTCTINESSASVAVVVGNLNDVDDCIFISDGTGHAVNVGTISSTASMDWNCTATGYVSGSTGSPVTTGTSGNETILCSVASGQTLTINVGTGATTPSVKNDGSGSVNVVAGSVTVTGTAVEEDGTPISGANVHLEATSTTGTLPAGDTVTISNSNTTATVTHTAHGMLTGDKVVIRGASSTENLGVFTITVTGANAYTYTMSGRAFNKVRQYYDITDTDFLELNGATYLGGERWSFPPTTNTAGVREISTLSYVCTNTLRYRVKIRIRALSGTPNVNLQLVEQFGTFVPQLDQTVGLTTSFQTFSYETTITTSGKHYLRVRSGDSQAKDIEITEWLLYEEATSPTGTITSTFVVLNGTTNASGEVTMSRTFASNQSVFGRIRKATAGTLYKQASLTGTVLSASGGNLTGVLISDE